MRYISKGSGPTKLEVGETVMVSIDGKEIPCMVSSCPGTSCSMCVLDGACVNWDYRVAKRRAAAFIPLEDLVE